MRRTHQRPRIHEKSSGRIHKKYLPSPALLRRRRQSQSHYIENSTWNWKGNSGFQRTCVNRRNWWWLSQSFYDLESCELADTKNHGWSFSCDGWSETVRQLPCLRPALSWCHKTRGPGVSQRGLCNKEETQWNTGSNWEMTRSVWIFFYHLVNIAITKQGKE